MPALLREESETRIEANGAELRTAAAGELTVAFVRFIDFSPTEELDRVLEHVQRAMVPSA